MNHPCKECLSYVPQAKCNGNGPSIGITDISNRQKPCGLYKTEVEVTPIVFNSTVEKEVKNAIDEITKEAIAKGTGQALASETQKGDWLLEMLTSKTVKELKYLCDEKGIKYKARETKTELIKLLNNI